MFSFDVIKAKYGDCLMLRAGDGLTNILIDGGPSATFDQALKSRLKSLARTLPDDDRPLIDLLIVSHIDSDHIGGVIKLLEFEKNATGGENISLVALRNLWHNSFIDILSSAAEYAPTDQSAKVEPASLIKSLSTRWSMGSDSKVVMSSVGQGNTLSNLARFHKMRVNLDFDDRLVKEGPIVERYDPFKLHVLGPKQEELDRLRSDWIKYMEEKRKHPDQVDAASVERLDTAVANLSSIVIMAECAGRRILLTGDARGDYVIDALQRNGYMKDGVCKIDAFKWPHHGSIKNLPKGIFKSIIADHHIISANGRHDNPDLASLKRFFDEHVPDQEATIHMTYGPENLRHGTEVQAIFDEAIDDKHKVTFNTLKKREQPWLSIDFG